MRSGAQTLVMLAAPLNCLILRALSDGPKPQAQLRREAGLPAQTTLRAQLKRLDDMRTVAKQRRNRFPGVLDYELTAAGRDLLFVSEILESWLERAPGGPVPLGGSRGKAATKALVEGWSTTMLRALAAGPLSLTELDGVIGSLSYPSLERRLAAMRLAGQVEPQPSDGRGTPYAVTRWLRQGIAPLAAASRWERRHLPQATPAIARLDVEATFLLVVPLLRLPSELSGSCQLATEVPNGNAEQLAGVVADVENGEVVACSTQLRGSPDAWIIGPPGVWLSGLIERDDRGLELGGDCRLARASLDGLHEALFRAAPAQSAAG